MRARDLTAVCIVAALGAYLPVSQANQENAGHRWMPKQPGNTYWQTPNWSGFNQPPAYNSPPVYGNANQAPVSAPPVPAYRPPQRPNNYPAPYANNPGNNMGHNGPGSYRAYPPPRGPYGGPNRGSYYRPDNGASAFNVPGYNRYRNNNGWNNNGWNNNKFWGRSGPNTWMNPNKGNMEQGWDDMINAPSRVGTMPGGWNAPEVSMPNPIDVGDQMQDNMKDLPEQMRDMDVGNN